MIKARNTVVKPIYRFLIAGIIILLGFYVGVLFTPAAPKVSKVYIKNASANISLAIENGLEINVGDEIIKLSGEEIKNWAQEYIRNYNDGKDIRLKPNMLKEYVDALAIQVETQPVNGKFEIHDGRVSIFQPSTPGKKIDTNEAVYTIAKAIRDGQTSTVLAVQITEPEVTLDKINSFGINTLLGRGESNFTGSHQARIHNIKVGIGRFNGILLKPGEEFSFNNILGEVDEKSGYQPELVIKNGQIVPEYGGGLCQVSTTLFRSAIYAGLPIVERKSHSFPVRYYTPQGFDSTIYPGITDLKFVNNTPNYILIQSKISGTKLIFEIYGSSDSRIVSVDGPYQYDQKPNGSMKAYFIRNTTYADGSENKERFDSFYKPPPASPLERNPLE